VCSERQGAGEGYLIVATTMAACWGLRVFEAVEMGGDAGLSGQGRLMEARDCGDGASGPATAFTQTRGRNEWRAWDLAGRLSVLCGVLRRRVVGPAYLCRVGAWWWAVELEA
jgi:hypothetical protein